MSIPEVLKRYALTNPVTISERRVLKAVDSANQSLAAGAAISLAINSAASVPSTPPLGSVGTDIILTAGQIVLLEKFMVSVFEADASGKLQIKSAGVFDSAGNLLLPLKTNGSLLPYTFAPIAQDTCFFAADPESDEAMVVDPDSIALSGMVLNFGVGISMLNLDGAAAHTYFRSLDIQYRVVSGVNPGVPRVINLD